MGKQSLKLLVEGGKATPAPPLGPALSQAKLNVGQVIAKINEKTKSFAGMQVPVEVIYDPSDKTFDIKVGTPPVSALIKKELKKEKLAKTPWKEPPVADLTIKQALEIAKAKRDKLNTDNVKKAVKQIIASCVSLGVTVEGKNPKDVLKEIDEGKYDKELNW
ncbi:MAG: 50S ribosomal protein L11 [Candidatus Aenigmatarchaeota archaeon]|nr:50S ribosomal protein L11 [Candidatus Aenigmarchaeota archaeon]